MSLNMQAERVAIPHVSLDVNFCENFWRWYKQTNAIERLERKKVKCAHDRSKEILKFSQYYRKNQINQYGRYAYRHVI